jgi:hypothetical protein
LASAWTRPVTSELQQLGPDEVLNAQDSADLVKSQVVVEAWGVK